jgi:ubiquinone/menaquinone biosynthesis C-methylase UbiE
MEDMKTDQHKTNIAEYFNVKDNRYWSWVYSQEKSDRKRFMTKEIIKRKDVVLRFVDKFSACKSINILDVGCGAGVFMKEMLDRGHAVTGIDITEGMLKQAADALNNAGYGNANCVYGDVEALPFENEMYDLVICVGVMQYLRKDEKAISELSRVVKPEGIVIITLPNIFRITTLLDPYYYLVKIVKYMLKKCLRRGKDISYDFGKNDSFINRRYYHGQINKLLQQNKLQLLDSEGIGYGPLTFFRKEILPDSISSRISELLEQVADRKQFNFFRVFANRWVICLKKS